MDFCSDVLRSVATEVVTHQLAVLETCGRGIALITVPQTVFCDRSGETQAGDLGPTLQLGVDLKQEQSTACAVTASALPCCAYGDVPKAVRLIPFTCGEYCSRPPRYMVEIWVCLCMYSSADLFGLFFLSSAGCGSPGYARTAKLHVPSEFYTLLPNQEVQERDKKDEGIKDEIGEREGLA